MRAEMLVTLMIAPAGDWRRNGTAAAAGRDDRADVEVDDRVELGVGDRFEGPALHHVAGIVDEHVEAAERLCRLRHQPGPRPAFGEIAPEQDGAAARRLDGRLASPPRLPRFAWKWTATMRAAGAEGGGRGGADPRACAGDEDPAAGELMLRRRLDHRPAQPEKGCPGLPGGDRAPRWRRGRAQGGWMPSVSRSAAYQDSSPDSCAIRSR